MITPKLSFEPRERAPYTESHAYFHPAFFRGEMRRSWPKVICYTLLLFFVLPLPLLFQANARSNWQVWELSGSLARMLNDGVWLYCLATVAIALFAGMLATIYLCRRPSVDFYHSLPIRREGLLLQGWLCGMIQFVTALVFNVLLSMLIIFTTVGQLAYIGEPILRLLIAAGYMLLTYLLFFTLTVFCGLLCGTSFMQIMVTGLVLGAVPLFRALALAFCDMVTDTIDMGYYANFGWEWTTPLARLILLSSSNGNSYYVNGIEIVRHVLERPFAWWEILLWIVASAALFFGAMWLYRKRHVERAGTPVVFEGVATAVKWVVIVLATMSMGWLFGEIGNGAGWILFGFLLGGLLSFMLINTILTKNPKQMFRGWRAIVIYLIAFCVGSVGIGYAVSEVEDIIPERVDRVAIYFGNDNYNVPYYTDPTVIEAWQELWREEIWKEAHYNADEFKPQAVYTETVGESISGEVVHEFASRRLSIRAFVKFGPFVIAYQTRSVERAAAEKLIRAVTESAEFETGWDSIMEELVTRTVYEDDEYWNEKYVHLSMMSLFSELYRDRAGLIGDNNNDSLSKTSTFPPPADALARMVAEMPEDIGFDFFQYPAYINVEVDWLNRACDERLSPGGSPQNYWFQHRVGTNNPVFYRDTLGLSETAFYDALAELILRDTGGLYVVKRVSGRFYLSNQNARLITDHNQIVEILTGISTLSHDSWDLSPFTVLDEEYAVVFPESTSSGVTYFIKGRTPAFVKSLWG